ncbi:MAG: MMPL family transporter [Candidatus Aminicenantes bacterium]|nr:MMPL family transporter [Candidatus Aminicenantes bacterium]
MKPKFYKKITGFFSALALFSYRKHRIILLVSVLVLISGPLLLKNLKIEPMLLDAKGLRGKEFKLFIDNYKRFGESTPLVLLQKHSQTDEQVRDQFTQALVQELAGMKEIRYVQSGLFDLAEQDQLVQMCRAVIFQDPDKYLSLFSDKFTEQGIQTEIIRTRKQVVMTGHPGLRELIAVDVFHLRELLESWLKNFMANYKISPHSFYFDSQDMSSRLIFAQPRGSGEDTQYCIELTTEISEKIMHIKSSLPGSQSITCEFAGKYGLTAETHSILNKEIFVINVISSILIFTLLILVFRNLKVTLMCFLPIFFSVYGSLLVASLFFNPLKMISIGFAAIVLGLGVDITFHLSSRFFQYHKKLKSLDKALQITLTDCGPPLFIGITTTACGFLVLSFSRYPALRQFGLLTSISLFLSLTVTLVLFPAVVRWLKPRSSAQVKLTSLGALPRILYRLSLKKTDFSRIAAFSIIILSILVMMNLRFDMSLFKLLPQNIPSLTNARHVSQKFGSSFILSTQVTLKTDQLSKGMQYQKNLDQHLIALAQEEKITGFYSPSMFYVPEDQVQARLAQICDVSSRIKENRSFFFKQMNRSGFRVLDRHKEYYDLLEEIFKMENLVSLSDHPSFSRFIKKQGKHFFLQTYVWPKKELAKQDLLLSVSEKLENLPSPPYIEKQLTGTYQVHQSVNTIIKRDFVSISLWAGGIISIILLLYFKKIRLLLVSLLPLIGAIPLTLALVTLLSIRFSPALIGVVAMVIGIGIDDSVHLIHRKISSPDKDISEILREIAPVLTLTTASTMICFLTLLLSSSPLVSNTGKIVSFGIFACWLFTMFLLPSFLKRSHL